MPMTPVTLPKGTELKGYRYVGDEAEALGTRLDAARAALVNAKTEWAKKHWQMAIDQLLVQWRALPILHDGDAQVQIIPRWTVDYDFYELGGEVGYGYFDRLFESKPDLNASWERNRAARLARCQ